MLKDTWRCGQGELGIEAPTQKLVDDPLSVLRHSCLCVSKVLQEREEEKPFSWEADSTKMSCIRSLGYTVNEAGDETVNFFFYDGCDKRMLFKIISI